MSAPDYPRQWTGRLWSDGPTVDRRRLARQAITVDADAGPVPLTLTPADGLAEKVGELENLGELSGCGVAIGTTNLPPGTYRVGVSLAAGDVELDGGVMVFRGARLSGVTILQDEAAPAWPEAQIIVHPREAEPLEPAVPRDYRTERQILADERTYALRGRCTTCGELVEGTFGYGQSPYPSPLLAVRGQVCPVCGCPTVRFVMALDFLEAAEAAEQDALAFTVLVRELDLIPAEAAHFVRRMRDHRGQHIGPRSPRGGDGADPPPGVT